MAITTELHITFQGLCVLVPSKDETFVDVIMPDSAGSPHPHTGHLESNGRGRDPMKNFRLDLMSLGARSTVKYPIPNVHDVGTLCSVQVPADHLLDSNPHPSVDSRIRLPAPDRLVSGPRVAFQVGPIATNIVWLTHEYTFVYLNVNIQDGDFKCHSMRGNPTPRNVNRPDPEPSSPNVLPILVQNFPHHIPDPCPGDPIEHVQSYYDYLNCSGPVVRLRSPNPACRDKARNDAVPPEFASTARTSLAFNCMLGQAPPA